MGNSSGQSAESTKQSADSATTKETPDAAQEPSDIKALYQRATDLRKKNDYEAALPLYIQLAEAGHVEGIEWCGHMHELGNGTAKDIAAACRYYPQGAEKESVFSKSRLGDLLLKGDGVARDIARGNKYLLEAAENDKTGKAQFLLGHFYYGSYNIDAFEPDYEKSLYWYREALEKTPEDDATLYNIGLHYEYGFGVEKDTSVALSYYSRALKVGSKLAKGKIRELKKKMAPEFSYELFNASYDLELLTQQITQSRTLRIPILISGPNGTGKTSFAVHLAEKLELGISICTVENLNIRAAFAAAEEKGEILVFDNVGEIFSSNVYRRKEVLQTGAVLIEQMQSFSYPLICIISEEDELARHVYEEFIFHIQLEYLTREQNKKAYRMFFNQEPPEGLSHIGALVPQDYAQTHKRLFVLNEEDNSDAIIARLKRISEQRTKSIIEDTSNRQFDSSLINADLDITEFTRKLKEMGADNPFSVLLYGPPGTGKSEYLRHMAEEIGIEVIVKRSSDLMGSMWGEPARNIAATFREAADRKSLLIFDEIDGLLTDRTGSDASRHLHVVQQVNEMLTWMESHPYPFAGTTNHLDAIDRAAIRRFVFKVKFDFMTKEQTRKAFQTFFGLEAPADIDGIGGLTPGDFAVVRKKAKIFGELHDVPKLIDLLKTEAKTKSHSAITHLKPENVTFNMKLAKTDRDLVEIQNRLLEPGATKHFSFLLYGAPGTGKSQYLRYLAAQLGMECIQKRASDLISKWWGDSEKHIAAAFREAEERKAFLIIDEADSMLSRRDTTSADHNTHQHTIRQVNEMLTWMESHPYPFACTTNLMEHIDKAALRRFMFTVKFDYFEAEQTREAFRSFFDIDAPEEFTTLKMLTPAIFASVKKKAELFGTLDKPEKVVSLLRDEIRIFGYKEKEKPEEISTDEITLPAIPLSTTPLSEGTSMLQAGVVAIRTDGGHGSGYFISQDGYLITNQHVVKDNKFVTVQLATGRQLPGEVIRTHAQRDVALVQINERNLPALPLQRQELNAGAEIFAIGAPVHLSYASTITRGIVSAYRERDGMRVIQSDVTTHGGSSGGAIVDGYGNVIATHVSGLVRNGMEMGMNFSIPIMECLKYLNVTIKDSPPEG